MLQKNLFMLFERYMPKLKKYDSISFLHQPMTSGQPLKIVQRHMAHPVVHTFNPCIGLGIVQHFRLLCAFWESFSRPSNNNHNRPSFKQWAVKINTSDM
jgi:hypothetical protein